MYYAHFLPARLPGDFVPEGSPFVGSAAFVASEWSRCVRKTRLSSLLEIELLVTREGHSFTASTLSREIKRQDADCRLSSESQRE